MKGAKASGAGAIILGTALVSLAWLGVLWFLFAHSQPCPNVTDTGLTARWLGCRTSNEIGDFLAGAFAPLAFVWLAVAVIIQSSELKAQREEFALSREVAEETQKAIKAQAEEARKQAEFIGAQTKLLEAAEAARHADQKAREFEALIGKLAGVVKSNPLAGYAEGQVIDSMGHKATVELFDVRRYKGATNHRDFLWSVTHSIVEAVNELQTSPVPRGKPFRWSSRKQFDTVQACFHELIVCIDHLPVESKILAQQLRLEPAYAAMTRFAEMLEGELAEEAPTTEQASQTDLQWKVRPG